MAGLVNSMLVIPSPQRDIHILRAAKAMGMSRPRTIFSIVIPQMIRLSIGPWTNEFSSELKDTSLAYVVGVVEIMRNAKYIIAYTYGNTAAVYLFVGILYFTLTRIGTYFFYKLEDRLWVPGFSDRGSIKRAILEIGRQDVLTQGLTPVGDMEIIGSSSDHTIVDLKGTDAKVGDQIRFHLNYAAQLSAMTLAYIEKVYLNEGQYE
jgi:hypothetical protein